MKTFLAAIVGVLMVWGAIGGVEGQSTPTPTPTATATCEATLCDVVATQHETNLVLVILLGATLGIVAWMKV